MDSMLFIPRSNSSSSSSSSSSSGSIKVTSKLSNSCLLQNQASRVSFERLQELRNTFFKALMDHRALDPKFEAEGFLKSSLDVTVSAAAKSLLSPSGHITDMPTSLFNTYIPQYCSREEIYQLSQICKHFCYLINQPDFIKSFMQSHQDGLLDFFPSLQVNHRQMTHIFNRTLKSTVLSTQSQPLIFSSRVGKGLIALRPGTGDAILASRYPDRRNSKPSATHTINPAVAICYNIEYITVKNMLVRISLDNSIMTVETWNFNKNWKHNSFQIDCRVEDLNVSMESLSKVYRSGEREISLRVILDTHTYTPIFSYFLFCIDLRTGTFTRHALNSPRKTNPLHWLLTNPFSAIYLPSKRTVKFVDKDDAQGITMEFESKNHVNIFSRKWQIGTLDVSPDHSRIVAASFSTLTIFDINKNVSRSCDFKGTCSLKFLSNSLILAVGTSGYSILNDSLTVIRSEKTPAVDVVICEEPGYQFQWGKLRLTGLAQAIKNVSAALPKKKEKRKL